MDDTDKHWTTIQGRKSSMESKMQEEHSNSVCLPGKSSKRNVDAGIWASTRVGEPAASGEERTEIDMSLGQDFA